MFALGTHRRRLSGMSSNSPHAEMSVSASTSPESTPQEFSAVYRGYVLILFALIYMLNSMDRSIFWVVLEPMKRDLHLTDAQMGLLSGFAFALIYAMVGVPIGHLADHRSRKRILVFCVAFWSLMTGLCGVVRSFTQMFLARVAVGAGESGAPPASMSMIADLYGPARRSAAIGIFMSAAPLGIMVVYLAASWVAQLYGWRSAFLLAAAPGLLLALVVAWTVREPRRGLSEVLRETAGGLSFPQTWSFIRGQRSILYLYAAITLTTLTGTGVSTFMTSFLMRTHHLPIAAAGQMSALGWGLSGVALPFIGAAADRLGKRDPRWLPWISVGLSGSAIPVLAASLSIADARAMWLLLPLWLVLSTGWIGIAYSMLQSLVGVHMRSTATSFQYVLTNLVGIGFGAPLVGVLSEALRPGFGVSSLRDAMLLTYCLNFLTVVALLACAGRVEADLARARRI